MGEGKGEEEGKERKEVGEGRGAERARRVRSWEREEEQGGRGEKGGGAGRARAGGTNIIKAITLAHNKKPGQQGRVTLILLTFTREAE